ncbi:ParB/RepB/Spo0J family partition protein [Variovorax rhizosphaerae]|uniref:ParB/RepB/Spo0J family partition protein n=1 Tax=Variovorax rhizosphaerae TaxID=1836200 RepID=A0ABU8WR32_9BURK
MASTRKRLELLTAGLSLPTDTAKEPAPARQAASTNDAPPSAATAVETRFPPAVAGALAPRTAPGQMMAFRGQIQQVEGEMAALRDRLREYEGSLPTRKMDPKSIRPSRWANRHEASFATSEFAGLKADMEHAGGNVQPILVRPLTGEAGQFELVFGHRRHRAALELGIPVLASIWVDELGDAALFAAMDRENRERSDLSAYEQGAMYRRALEEQLFPTQRQLAEGLGVSHTWVRKALMVAQLPDAVVECFRSPLEITFRHAEQINSAMEKDRRGFLRRIERVRGHGLSPSMVVARLLDAKPGFERTERLDVQAGGEKLGALVRSKTGEIVITITPEAAAAASQETLEAAIAESLKKARSLG